MGPQHYSPTCEFGPVRHLEHKTPTGPCPGWQEGWPMDPAPMPAPVEDTVVVPANPEQPTVEVPGTPEVTAEVIEDLLTRLRAGDLAPDDPEVLAAVTGGTRGGPAQRLRGYLGGLRSYGGGGHSMQQPGGKIYDWPAVRRYYVEGYKTDTTVAWPSLDETAAHFDVNPGRVKEKSAQEGWVTLRQRWQAQVETKRQQARAAQLAKQGVDLDNAALESARVGMQLCAFELKRIGQAAQNARAGGDLTAGRIDALEMTRIASAIDLFHKVGLRAIGDPETMRLELTGANGAPIEIASELRRDDPTRIAGVLGVLQQAGLGELFGGTGVETQVQMRELIASQTEDGA